MTIQIAISPLTQLKKGSHLSLSLIHYIPAIQSYVNLVFLQTTNLAISTTNPFSSHSPPVLKTPSGAFFPWSLSICVFHPLHPHASYPWSPEKPRAPDPPERRVEDTHGELHSESTAAGGPVEHHHWQQLTSRADHKQHRDLLQQTGWSFHASLSARVFQAFFSPLPLGHMHSIFIHLHCYLAMLHKSLNILLRLYTTKVKLVLLCSDKHLSSFDS